MTYYKVLAENGRPHHGGNGVWPLPTDGKPGEWLKVEGELVPCEHGLHLCRKQDLVHWLGPVIYEAEPRGEIIVHENKVVVAEARLLRRVEAWNERTARLFAADCAEAVLNLVPEAKRGPFVAAIGAARAFANGEIDDNERDAARYAAWAAAGTAAGAAQGDAAWAAARDAARYAAWAAAWDAQGDAQGDAAGAAARAAQTELLFDYLEGDDDD